MPETISSTISGCKVVEESEGGAALTGQIIRAVIHDVVSDAFPLSKRGCDDCFGAYSINGEAENRFLKFLKRCGINDAGEPSNASEDFIGIGFLHVFLESAHSFLSPSNIDAGIGVARHS